MTSVLKILYFYRWWFSFLWRQGHNRQMGELYKKGWYWWHCRGYQGCDQICISVEDKACVLAWGWGSGCSSFWQGHAYRHLYSSPWWRYVSIDCFESSDPRVGILCAYLLTKLSTRLGFSETWFAIKFAFEFAIRSKWFKNSLNRLWSAFFDSQLERRLANHVTLLGLTVEGKSPCRFDLHFSSTVHLGNPNF